MPKGYNPEYFKLLESNARIAYFFGKVRFFNSSPTDLTNKILELAEEFEASWDDEEGDYDEKIEAFIIGNLKAMDWYDQEAEKKFFEHYGTRTTAAPPHRFELATNAEAFLRIIGNTEPTTGTVTARFPESSYYSPINPEALLRPWDPGSFAPDPGMLQRIRDRE
jgi:hypothetical protein